VLQYTLSTFPSFLAFFAVAAAVLAVFCAVYMQLTPYAELALIREGNVAASVSLGGTVIGLALPVANVVQNSHALLDVVVWGVIACLVQLLTYAAARVALPHLAKDIPAGRLAGAIFLAALSIAVGLINAACMES
jgi:putative membrane protein